MHVCVNVHSFLHLITTVTKTFNKRSDKCDTDELQLNQIYRNNLKFTALVRADKVVCICASTFNITNNKSTIILCITEKDNGNVIVTWYVLTLSLSLSICVFVCMWAYTYAYRTYKNIECVAERRRNEEFQSIFLLLLLLLLVDSIVHCFVLCFSTRFFFLFYVFLFFQFYSFYSVLEPFTHTNCIYIQICAISIHTLRVFIDWNECLWY